MSETVKTTVEITTFDPGDERPEYKQVHPLGEMTIDQRLATMSLIRSSLVEAIEKLDDWVPGSFVARSGVGLNLIISFDMVDVDVSVLKRQLEAQRELQQVHAELLALRDDLG